ncbi:cupin domain-containing protein [Pseudodesulfovibrio sp. JC047]|uniref:cupin domain-containing protein n=1 Tax=Pseudodesulfovibrio sp. JC047 TaxID=2683199 RepID=UPI0013D51281|nr:cupin domain-containing protein [Pseudodesulfovibrio sp. JC047]NDV18237.1 cupin domain-containing protein [Pseudodesulfovibrio sp. JC047]
MIPAAAQDIIDLLGLTPHPEEGGWFLETHRSEEFFSQKNLPSRYDGDRCYSTAIYYLLTPETYSHMHCLKTDEIFHFYAGAPCEMIQLHQDGSGQTILLGNDLVAGQRPQVRVPGSSWQGMRLVPGGTFALMGCSVAPGFEYVDYTHGERQSLVEAFPAFAEAIIRLTT